MTTLIKNGTIVTATETYKADILVKNGVISEIGREISKIASEIVDAAEKWVLPGAVDVHTHIDAQCDGMTTVDDFETGTAAAAAGGTTTVVDYAEQEPGVTLAQTLEKWKTKAGSASRHRLRISSGPAGGQRFDLVRNPGDDRFRRDELQDLARRRRRTLHQRCRRAGVSSAGGSGRRARLRSCRKRPGHQPLASTPGKRRPEPR